MTATDNLLSVEQVAERLHCSRWTVYEELNSGALRGSKPRQRWLIPESALAEYLAKHSNEAERETPKRRRRRKW